MNIYQLNHVESLATSCSWEVQERLGDGSLNLHSCQHSGNVLISSLPQSDLLRVEDLSMTSVMGQTIHELPLEQLEELLKRLASINPSPSTESWGTMRQRRGHQNYKQSMSALCEHRCVVTGCSIPELLFASHAKPWSVASDEERLDPYNGFLLESRYDRLFDRGYITFDDDGAMLLSQRLDDETQKCLQLDSQLRLRISLTAQHRVYLGYHRSNIFE